MFLNHSKLERDWIAPSDACHTHGFSFELLFGSWNDYNVKTRIRMTTIKITARQPKKSNFFCGEKEKREAMKTVMQIQIDVQKNHALQIIKSINLLLGA